MVKLHIDIPETVTCVRTQIGTRADIGVDEQDLLQVTDPW